MPMLELIIDVVNWWNGVNKIKANLKKNPDAIKLGVLSAAGINFPALFDPVQTHPGVVIAAIAARSKAKAEAQVAKYKLDAVKVYDSYEEVLKDPEIDAVYVPLPNGLHHKWALNALRAGKHVLIEKPIASNAAEAKEIQDCANETGKIALEAYHWRFHPAAHRVKEIIESGKYGHLTGVFSKMILPPGTLVTNDIRLNYELGGGASMDLCYVLSSSLYWAAAPNDVKGTSFEVLSTKPQLSKRDNRIDENMDTTITITNADSTRPPVKCTTVSKLVPPKLLGFIPQMWAFVTPFIGHKIIVTDKSGKKTTESCYTGGPLWGERGEPWWTSYRYQLEGFVDRIKAAKNQEKYDGPWVDLDESVKLMEMVDAVYEKSGMPKRGVE
ncbi:oxidoreductase family, NAD-binding rossmann fold domain-containing protein [Trichoderma breve]|uniref:D-xylose 1-dehydrogenase (NADP(+), D-xylono-1,5-lactone-forming) n=1 Tax=Trichoderma breve TaxID=2034170 RepID=A0A9W9E4N9_9HYPO|nr:oxidoreductase family, NAD-binding rossmann fold domain-containing protein [Trichoderma breve]KAJ4858933.1 oxidoreductase family, NAD-binding rossmann fold domain-containing protein [Trichoderma breve]